MDRLDFLLVNALQVNPRATWSQLGPVLEIDATTLSRRWARLSAEGLVWSSCYPVTYREWSTVSVTSTSFVEVRCVPGRREEVIQAVARHTGVVSIECTSGARDLLLTLSHLNATLADVYVSGMLANVPGVLATRTHAIRRYYKEGSTWRLNLLTHRQMMEIERMKGTVRGVPDAPTRLLSSVMEALSSDIRRPAAAIALELGRSLSTVNKAITQLMHADWARTRVDFAHDLVDYGPMCLLWYNVPPAQVEAVSASFSVIPEVRMCASIVSAANIAVALWMRDLAELDEIEIRIARAFPEIQIVDRWMIQRIAKHNGHLLDIDGRHTGYLAESREWGIPAGVFSRS